METTFLGLAMPKVLQQLKLILIRKGFLIQTLPTSNPVIVACQQGNWLRRPRHLVLEISSIENNLTRIDITAIVNNKNNRSNQAAIELSIASIISGVFNKVITTRNGN